MKISNNKNVLLSNKKNQNNNNFLSSSNPKQTKPIHQEINNNIQHLQTSSNNILKITPSGHVNYPQNCTILNNQNVIKNHNVSKQLETVQN